MSPIEEGPRCPWRGNIAVIGAAIRVCAVIAFGAAAESALSEDEELTEKTFAVCEFTSLSEFHAGLALQAETWEAADDARAVFATIYQITLRRLVEAIDEGRFRDPDWIEQFAVAFGRMYQQALLHYELNRLPELPTAWIKAFATAANGTASPLVHAVLGIHAHVNHDLAHVVASMVTDSNREAQFADFRTADAVFAKAIDEIQATLAEKFDPGLAVLDDTAGRIDEALVDFLLRRWRLRAWIIGTAMADAETELERVWIEFILNESTGFLATAIAGRH